MAGKNHGPNWLTIMEMAAAAFAAVGGAAERDSASGSSVLHVIPRAIELQLTTDSIVPEGGYPAEWFVVPADENLQCPICHSVFKEPVTCKEGHTYCNSCITRWLAVHKNCPVDRKHLTASKLIRNLPVRGVIENLEVFCINKIPSEAANKFVKTEQGARQPMSPIGCAAKHKLKDQKQHLSNCQFQLVQCPFELCSQKIMRKDAAEHIQICQHRPLECESCGLRFALKSFKDHKENCPMLPVCCINRCMTNNRVTLVPRAFMEDHVNNICQRSIIKCKFESIGCDASMARNLLNNHLKHGMDNHMILLLEENKKLKEELQTLKKTVSSRINSTQDNKSGSYLWTVRNFSKLTEQFPNTNSFVSPIFWLCAFPWRLRLYPNGAQLGQPLFVSLYLERQVNVENGGGNGVVIGNSPVSVAFSLSVLSTDISQESYIKSIEQPLDFGEKEDTQWGFDKFFPVGFAKSNHFCKDDTIKIRCSIQIEI